MSAIGKAHHEAVQAVARIADPVIEMSRRFGVVEWVEHITRKPDGTIIARYLDGRWKVSGKEHGLRQRIPNHPTSKDTDDAKENIARAGLYNDEMRKARRP